MGWTGIEPVPEYIKNAASGGALTAAAMPTPTAASATVAAPPPAMTTAAPAPAMTPAMTTDPTKMTPSALASMAGPMQGATTYKPDDNALVANQLNKLLSGDSPYITRARTAAAQYANSRGLLNSSMAAGAGEGAAIDAGLPIASADASTFARAQSEGAAAQNQFSRDANQFGREGALTVANAGFRAGENAAAREQQTSERTASQDFTAGRDITLGNQRLTEIKAQTEAALQQYDARDRTTLSADYRQSTQRTYDDYTNEVNKIQQSDMDADVKAAQIQGLQAVYADRQVFINTLFQNAPQWASAWSQVAIDWDGED